MTKRSLSYRDTTFPAGASFGLERGSTAVEGSGTPKIPPKFAASVMSHLAFNVAARWSDPVAEPRAVGIVFSSWRGQMSCLACYFWRCCARCLLCCRSSLTPCTATKARNLLFVPAMSAADQTHLLTASVRDIGHARARALEARPAHQVLTTANGFGNRGVFPDCGERVGPRKPRGLDLPDLCSARRARAKEEGAS
jgi:hypothetical protein